MKSSSCRISGIAFHKCSKQCPFNSFIPRITSKIAPNVSVLKSRSTSEISVPGSLLSGSKNVPTINVDGKVIKYCLNTAQSGTVYCQTPSIFRDFCELIGDWNAGMFLVGYWLSGVSPIRNPTWYSRKVSPSAVFWGELRHHWTLFLPSRPPRNRVTQVFYGKTWVQYTPRTPT